MIRLIYLFRNPPSVKALRLLVLAISLLCLATLHGIFAIDFSTNMTKLANQLNPGVRHAYIILLPSGLADARKYAYVR